MPSRDDDPSRDDERPSERWSGEPSRDATRREAERRSARGPAFDGLDAGDPHTPEGAGRAGSAFGSAREVRSTGQMGPGGSYGGSGGRASGSQAFGQRPAAPRQSEPPTPEAWDDRDGPPPAYGRSDTDEAAARSGNARGSPASEPRNTWADTTRGRSRQAETQERRRSWQRGLEREEDTQFDADYRQWRDEQMRLLDRDYAQWRKERYRKFAEELSQWRSQRLPSHGQASTQRSSAEGQPPPLGDITPLGTPPGKPARTEERERPPERERSGGLLGSLLGSHGDRHKP